MIREIGSYDVKIDNDGSVSFVGTPDTKDIALSLISLTNDVILDPPDGALSRNKKFEKERKIRQEYEDKAKLTIDRSIADQEEERKKYQSIESFVEHTIDEDKDQYNFYDLTKLTESTGLERDQVAKQLISYGLRSRTSSELLQIIKQIPRSASTRKIVRELLSIIRFI
jgi:hypothetical protein